METKNKVEIVKKKFCGETFVKKIIKELNEYIDGDLIKTFEEIDLGCDSIVDIFKQIRLQIINAGKNYHKPREIYLTSGILREIKEPKGKFKTTFGLELYEVTDAMLKREIIIKGKKEIVGFSYNKSDIFLNERNCKCGGVRSDEPFFDENVRVYCDTCQKKIDKHIQKLIRVWNKLEKKRLGNKNKEIYDKELKSKLWNMNHLLCYCGHTKNTKNKNIKNDK